jgi:hypothetical protein
LVAASLHTLQRASGVPMSGATGLRGAKAVFTRDLRDQFGNATDGATREKASLLLEGLGKTAKFV